MMRTELRQSGHQADAPGSNGTLNLRALPRQRMTRQLWKTAALVIAMEAACVAAAVGLIAWRGGIGNDSIKQDTLAADATTLLKGQLLVQESVAAQRALERIAQLPGVESVAVLDGAGNAVLQSAAGARERVQSVGLQGWLVSKWPVTTIRQPLEPTLGSQRKLVLRWRDPNAIRFALNGGLAIGLGSAVAGVLALPFLYRRFERVSCGLRQLHVGIRRLSLEAPLQPVPVVGNDEVAYLSLAFNDMASRLSTSKRALVEANRDLEYRVADRTQQLREANELLETQNKTLAELTDTALRFTDDVAHEFRTPLSVIMEFASITADGLGGEVTPKQAEYLRFIEGASKDLAHLVDDFLDTEKLRAGSLRVDRKAHQLRDILDSVWPMIQARASRMGVSLRRTQEDVPAVFVDGEKIGRAIINLATNAIKFSGRGTTVTISIRKGESGVEVAVRDEGAGMTPEQVASLFQRFKQTAEGVRSSSKGFGLGLTIVRDLIAMNLGEIHVSSEPGNGSTFAFTIPTIDPDCVLSRFFEQASLNAATTRIAAVRIKCGRERGQLSRETLVCMCAPMQIILPIEDTEWCCVIGETKLMSLLCSRLEEECRSSKPDDPDHLEYEIEELGTWPILEAEEQIRLHVMQASARS